MGSLRLFGNVVTLTLSIVNTICRLYHYTRTVISFLMLLTVFHNIIDILFMCPGKNKLVSNGISGIV